MLIRPVLLEGAEAMDRTFDSDNNTERTGIRNSKTWALTCPAWPDYPPIRLHEFNISLEHLKGSERKLNAVITPAGVIPATPWTPVYAPLLAPAGAIPSHISSYPPTAVAPVIGK